MGGFAWVTLATNDSYSLGALVLAHSLKKANTAHKLVVLITPSVSQPMREQLQTVFDIVKLVEVLDSKDEAHLALLKRPELGITFTKIHCWRLTEFEKCVFLDADTLVVRNCDELFEREELSAAPDFSWPDCFNSGVFVFKPSVETFDRILQFAVEKGSFDGGDQGLLNMFFSDWATQDIKKHLPFTYNLSSLAAYTYIPAFKQYGSETRIVHFIGTGKPWLQKLDPGTKTISPTPGAEHLTPMLQRWWDLFCEHVHPHLNKNLDNCNGMLQPAPAETCSRSIINEINDETQKPSNPEPHTLYREKDDFRQFNLPYQPFDVKGSSGELLNIEFLKVCAPPPSPPPQLEEKKELDKEETQNFEPMENTKTQELQENKETKNEEGKREEDEKENKKEIIEEVNAPKDPFDYNTFFPDEKCVNNYLAQNVATYQPFEQHNHQNQETVYQQPHHHDHNHNESSHTSVQLQNQDNHQRELQRNNPQANDQTNQYQNNDFQYRAEPLPRFLTIAEDDVRQSGNKCNENSVSKHTNHPTKEPSSLRQSFKETTAPPPLPPPLHHEDKPPEKSELKKSKSMPQLDVTKIGLTLKPSVWQSQPNVNTDPKKFLMPKLKPILPKSTSTLHKTVPSSFSKITLYTEFLMSSDYKAPLDLPKDKIGFVEMQLVQGGHLKRSKSERNFKSKFGPLPYVEEKKKLNTPKKRPFNSLDHQTELYDIRECKRQQGNKPKSKEDEKKEKVRYPFPKLLKNKKIGPLRRLKSRESVIVETDKENFNKKEIKKKKEDKIVKSDVDDQAKSSTQTNGKSNSVEDILVKLKNFSKDYIHYFGDFGKKHQTTQTDVGGKNKNNEEVESKNKNLNGVEKENGTEKLIISDKNVDSSYKTPTTNQEQPIKKSNEQIEAEEKNKKNESYTAEYSETKELNNNIAKVKHTVQQVILNGINTTHKKSEDEEDKGSKRVPLKNENKVLTSVEKKHSSETSYDNSPTEKSEKVNLVENKNDDQSLSQKIDAVSIDSNMGKEIKKKSTLKEEENQCQVREETKLEEKVENKKKPQNMKNSITLNSEFVKDFNDEDDGGERRTTKGKLEPDQHELEDVSEGELMKSKGENTSETSFAQNQG